MPKRINISTDNITLIYKSFSNIKNSKGFKDLDANGRIKPIYDTKKGNWNKVQKEEEIQKHIKNVCNKIAQTMYAIKEIDSSIDISAYVEKRNNKEIKEYKLLLNGKKMRLADEEFFKARGCTVKNGIVTLQIEDVVYTYNLNTKLLTYKNKKTGVCYHEPTRNGKPTERANMFFEFYVPQSIYGNNDYRSLDTITTITKNTNSVPYSNAFVVKVGVKDANKNFNQALTVQSTKFANKLLNSNKNSKNIVIGGSKFGAYSLQVVAKNKGLYKNVFCIDNALIVKGEGKNGYADKAKFASKDRALELDQEGLTVYFVSSKDDPNLSKKYVPSAKFGDSRCDSSFKDSYFYDGLKLANSYYKKTDIRVITDVDSEKQKYIKKLSNIYYDYNESKKIINTVSKFEGHKYAFIQDDITANYEKWLEYGSKK